MAYAQIVWKFRQADPKVIDRLTRNFKIDPVVAQILAQRGIDDPLRIERFLYPDLKRLTEPEAVPGVIAAAQLIHDAIKSDRTIVIYSDYDVDGVCGLTILAECLRMAGAQRLVPYIPDRIEEGYGLNIDAIRTLAGSYPGALLVTIDCGITAVEPVAEARRLGLDVILTDHHTFIETMPEANVLVHPKLPGGDPAVANLCGTGVAFKLAWQVAKQFGDGKKASPALRDFLVRGLGLVALATVADVMPLVDENRILVKHGLESLNKRRTLGMDALMQMSGVKPDRPVTSTTIGFQIAPRINAAGRMLHAFTAYELLTAKTPAEAEKLAYILEETNRSRRTIETEIVAQARAQFESDPKADTRNVVVVSDPGWHLGVVGIAASRLAELFHRPTIVLSIDQNGLAHGSARSIAGFNLIEALTECASHLKTFGGHSAAAGLKLLEGSIPEFREAFDRVVGELRTDTLGERELWIDAEIMMSRLDVGFVKTINDLEPHGNGNPKPIFAIAGVELFGDPILMGQEKKHVRLNMKHGDKILKVLAWNQADQVPDWKPGLKYDIAFTPSLNEWMGRVEIQAELKAIRLSES